MSLHLIGIERHRLGPRLHLLGRRVHEYHVGFALLAVSPAASADASPQLSPGKVVAAIVGLWLVVKDWPDLFKATRDKASWRLGLHRLPPGEGRAFANLCRDRWLGRFKAACGAAAAATATLRRITSSSPRKQSNGSQSLASREHSPVQAREGGTVFRIPPKRQRRFVRVTWALVALVGVAALASAAPTGASDAAGSPDAGLLRTHQPVLVFHPNELLRPTKVQSFVADSELERLVGPNPVLDTSWTVVDPDPEPGDLPPVTPGALYRLDQTACEADAPLAGRTCYAAAWGEGSGGDALYGRVVRTETRIVLQYWLFYYDNPLILPPTPFGTFWQSHEGDWEVVNVILGADETPLEAAYSQHCSGQRKAWSGVDKSPAGSTHPVAYVALGSHANFFSAPGAIPINPACIPAGLPPLPFIVDQVVDGSSLGAVVGPPGSGVDAATIHQIDGQSWSTFGGRWGESEYFFTPIAIPPVPANTAVPVGLAPASPANQANWNVPTILGWPLVP